MEEAVERDFESEARNEGWVPQEEWRGPDEKWKPAEQFVKDGENITPILRKKVERLEERVDSLLSTNKQLNEWSQKAQAKEKRENEKLLKELEQVRKQAVTEGDGDAFARADEQINELKSAPQQLDPVAEQWLAANSWYNTNDNLASFADGISDRLRAQGYTGKAYFDELTKRVRETFPDQFGNPQRQKPNSVESGGEREVSDSKAKTFENLPRDAKDMYKRFAKDIPGFTKEQYLENYDWE